MNMPCKDCVPSAGPRSLPIPVLIKECRLAALSPRDFSGSSPICVIVILRRLRAGDAGEPNERVFFPLCGYIGRSAVHGRQRRN